MQGAEEGHGVSIYHAERLHVMICRVEWLAGRRIFHRPYLTLSLHYFVVARHSWGRG